MKRDYDLLTELKSGREQAYKDLFHTYFSDLVAYANHLLRDQAAAEDMVQDFFITFWHERKYRHITKDLENYLYRSLYNNCLTYLRDEQRKQKNLLQMPVETASSPKLSFEAAETEREHRLIYRAIRQLPEQCKQVFTLCCMHGMTYQECADLLGVSINTVRTQMGRAFKFLRSALSEKLYLNLLFLYARKP